MPNNLILTQKSIVSSQGKNKIIAGMLSIFLGSFGAHKYYVGHNTQAAVFLGVGFLGLFIPMLLPAMVLIGIVEGVSYLRMDDLKFIEFVADKTRWFA